ncbi:DUF4382 domain-containing protein [Halobellus ruber]|uniref:DUF4382 domain-containing protein n=1 Tax=Halobellus ruber TaxID=2761102 RepID=A0A7J9SLY0_9EURY|nr:DUF4382 domain-containing protein [Halobellus ruber]MBB6647718.1 DUF4382 domain-containing protein [Halobellus ruber]
MNRNAVAAALVAGLVLLAGCSGGLTGTPDGTTGESALDGGTTAEEIEGETGTVNVYISDERNDIDDFEHLNVTISRVGVKPAGDDSDGEDADDEDADDTETEDVNTETATTESGETETETPDADEADDSDADDDVDDADQDDSEGESEWIEYEVDNRTVDLTELKGKNATKLSSLDVPNGSYEKVFVHVSEVEGTLKDGSDQRVKLPSGKLQLNSAFTVGDGEEVDFVFDITAIKAGNSGKYILKPVISESGTDVEIDDVDEEDDEREDDDDERTEGRENALNASFDGTVTAGENVTLGVTQDADPVEGATVFVDGERAGTTGADGAYVIQVPDDAEELDVKVTFQGAEAELEIELDSESDSEDGNATADGSQQRLTVG